MVWPPASSQEGNMGTNKHTRVEIEEGAWSHGSYKRLTFRTEFKETETPPHGLGPASLSQCHPHPHPVKSNYLQFPEHMDPSHCHSIPSAWDVTPSFISQGSTSLPSRYHSHISFSSRLSQASLGRGRHFIVWILIASFA